MRLSLRLGIALAILTLSTMSFAGTIVTMQYNGAGSNSYNGVPSYPYSVSVNGAPESLMCIGYSEHVTGSETWQANEMTVAGYGALIGDTLKAEQLASSISSLRAVIILPTPLLGTEMKVSLTSRVATL